MASETSEASNTVDTFLNDTWTLYFHDPDNDLWEIESYVPLATVSTVQEAADLHEALRPIGATACSS